MATSSPEVRASQTLPATGSADIRTITETLNLAEDSVKALKRSLRSDPEACLVFGSAYVVDLSKLRGHLVKIQPEIARIKAAKAKRLNEKRRRAS